MLYHMFKHGDWGRCFGFPVEINLSFLLLLGLVFVAFGGVAGVVIVCLAFASVLLHELGHALVARRLGVRVSRHRARRSSAARPRWSSCRAPRTTSSRSPRPVPRSRSCSPASASAWARVTHFPLFAWIGWTNLVLAVFNLIPALPMDGGRILRALLTRKMDFVRATDVSVTVARVAAVGFAIVGLDAARTSSCSSRRSCGSSARASACWRA